MFEGDVYETISYLFNSFITAACVKYITIEFCPIKESIVFLFGISNKITADTVKPLI